MKTILITFLVLITPALAALGHDFYLYYTADPDLERPFYLADIGWIWVTYHEQSHNDAVDFVGKEMWAEFIAPIMNQPAAILLSIPAFAIFLTMFVLKMFGIGPYEGEGVLYSKAKKVPVSKKGAPSGKMKFKRK